MPSRNPRQLQLAERHRNAERRGAARQPHGFQRIANSSPCTARCRPPRLADRQQRALHLDVVHVLRVGDARVRHGGADAGRHLLDLMHAPQMLARQIRRTCATERQRAAVRAPRRCRAPRTPSCVVRSAPSVPPDITTRDALHRRVRNVAAQHGLQRAHGEPAGEIVDEAVALRLAEDGEHAGGIDGAVRDRGLDAGDIVGSVGGGDGPWRWARRRPAIAPLSSTAVTSGSKCG